MSKQIRLAGPFWLSGFQCGDLLVTGDWLVVDEKTASAILAQASALGFDVEVEDVSKDPAPQPAQPTQTDVDAGESQ